MKSAFATPGLLLLSMWVVLPGDAAVNEEGRNIGLAVEPGWLLVPNVPVGQLYDMESRTRLRFKIHNGSDRPRRYCVKADRPGNVGVKVLKGYSGIPDPTWFWFEKSEVLAPAHGVGEVRMFVRIPDEERYCNQKWAVGIDVEGKPENGEGLVLSVSPIFYIETESRAETKERPAGFPGLAPATIVLGNAPLGRRQATLHAYNNDDRPHRYRIQSVVPFAEPGRQAISPSPGFAWIPRKEWIRPAVNGLEIGPQGQEKVVLNLDIPEETDVRNQRWEGIVFVESEEGSSTFARVQIAISER